MHTAIYHSVAPPHVATSSRFAARSPLPSPALPPTRSAPLNRVERLAALVGEWVGALAERWHPANGPFFVGDGQLAVVCAAFDIAE